MYNIEKQVKDTKGCIFCALGLKPIKMKRQYVHYQQFRIVVCNKEGVKPMSDPYKRGGSKGPVV